MVVGRNGGDLRMRYGDLRIEGGELEMLLMFLRTVVAASEGENQRVLALQLAEPARRRRVVGQLVVGKHRPGDHVGSHQRVLSTWSAASLAASSAVFPRS